MKSLTQHIRFLTIALSVFGLAGGLPAFAEEQRQIQAQIKEELNLPNLEAELDSIYKPVSLAWFDQFQDRQLTGYINRLIENNYELRSAELDLKSAELTGKRLQASRWSVFQGFIGFDRQKYSRDSFQNGRPARERRSIFQPGIRTNVPIDYMNKFKNQALALDYELTQKKLERDQLLVSLVSKMAENYFTLSKSEQMLALQEELVQNKQEQVKLYQDLFKLSLISQHDISNAYSELQDYKTLQGKLLVERKNNASGMLQLISAQPDQDTVPVSGLPPVALDTNYHPAEIPSDEVLNRQDVMIQFMELKKAKNDVTLQWKSAFPSFGLTGDLGSRSFSFSNLFNANRFYYSMGVDLLEPLLNLPDAKLRIKQAKYNYQSSVEDFKSGILGAFGEVSDLLYEIEHVDKEALHTEAEKEKRFQEMYAVYQADVEQGLRPRLDLLKVRESILKAQSAKLNRQYDYLKHCIQLYKATGGKLPAAAY